MNLEEIYQHCLLLQSVISSKGYFRPEVEFHLNWIGRKYSLGVEYRTNPDDYNSRVFKSFNSETDPFQTINEASVYVYGIVHFDEIKREQFLERLAHLVEDADKLNIEIPALRPVFEEYRNNLLTYQPAAAE